VQNLRRNRALRVIWVVCGVPAGSGAQNHYVRWPAMRGVWPNFTIQNQSQLRALRAKEEKVKRVITLIVLLALCLPVYAADKEEVQQYQVDVTIRFNSLSMAEFTEIQAVLDKLAKQSCKTTIELTKLEGVLEGRLYIGTTTLPTWSSTTLEVK